MSKNLFITATEPRSGKSAISLGIMELLLRHIDRVAFFRPLIKVPARERKTDNDIDLISTHFNLKLPAEKMYAFTAEEAAALMAGGREDELLEGILAKYKAVEETHDFVLCEGTDYGRSSSAFEFDINAEIAKNLGCPVLLTANAHGKALEEVLPSIIVAVESLLEKGCKVIATVANRTTPEDRDKILASLSNNPLFADQLVFAIPNNLSLSSPTVAEVAEILGAQVLYGREQLNRHVHSFTVAAMQLRNFLDRIENNTLIITPGDRADIIVACLSSLVSMSMPNITGILLTGGLKPEASIARLIEGFSSLVPILSASEDTFPVAKKVAKIHATISADDTRKIVRAIEVFEKNVDFEKLGQKIIESRTTIVTPKMFEYGLLQRAKAEQQHIVLPEGEEERILRAAEILLHREIATLTLLGDRQKILEKISQLGLRMDNVAIIDPHRSDLFEEYVRTYYELRRHKGISREFAHDVMSDVSFFGTMMVHLGHADGMVSGAVHTTQATVRPAFEIIRTKPGCSVVSSVFFMCLADRVLVYGDCAINPDPDEEQLAEIAIRSAQTAQTFGIEPRVALLSYSTGESGQGHDVDKVRAAVRIARKKCPGLEMEGPIQYDAAVDPEVARTKMPGSNVAGRATVFIFPDLNTGNNTYKAVQRSAGAVAVGPVLQGLNKPVNDLSRGCTVADVINTIAITAIQAQAEKRTS